MGSAPVSIKIEPGMKERVQRLAKAKDRSPHWLMREAIREYVEREEQRAALRRDAEQAWAEYKRTGLHATHQEADEWLAKLEQGQDVEPPQCHD